MWRVVNWQDVAKRYAAARQRVENLLLAPDPPQRRVPSVRVPGSGTCCSKAPCTDMSAGACLHLKCVNIPIRLLSGAFPVDGEAVGVTWGYSSPFTGSAPSL